MKTVALVFPNQLFEITPFKDLKCDFYKRSEGNVHFICNEGKAIESAVEQTIQSGERVNLPVSVIATVPDKFGNEPVAKFTITLSMKEKV